MRSILFPLIPCFAILLFLSDCGLGDAKRPGMAVQKDSAAPLPVNNTVTLLVDGNNIGQVYAYAGTFYPGIRIEKLGCDSCPRVEDFARMQTDSNIVFVVESCKETKYNSVIDVMDKLSRCGKKYMLTKARREELLSLSRITGHTYEELKNK